MTVIGLLSCMGLCLVLNANGLQIRQATVTVIALLFLMTPDEYYVFFVFA